VINVNDFASPFPAVSLSTNETLVLHLDHHRSVLICNDPGVYQGLDLELLRAAFTAVYLLGAAHGAMMSKTGGGA
jgi:hypothetical protein